MACNATLVDEVLTCIDEPQALPIQSTTAQSNGSLCPEELGYLTLNQGPHDARVFYGPAGASLVVYGSNSRFTCFGQWIQDFGGLVGSGSDRSDNDDERVVAAFMDRAGTELQRPPPYGAIEKNWFLFWDTEGAAHVHYDIAPRRAFARLNDARDGSVGENHASAGDDKCRARYLPRIEDAVHESIHQATNSLSVTLCRRADAGCTPDKDNTFIFTIFQHKTVHNFRGAYHPYVMLFRQTAPAFEVWAVGTRSLWISGRRVLARGDTDMFYITSMSWRDRARRTLAT